MADVKKGVVTIVADGSAVIKQTGSDAVTPPLALGSIKATVDDTVAYVLFDDGTGCIIAKV